MVAAARHRPGSRAAQARACGPPPDQPTVTNSAMPRASRTAARSAAAAATRRPGSGVEPSYPGRAYRTRRRPRSAAAAAIAGAGISPAGVPLCRTTVSPSGGPLARASSCRPPAAWTITFSVVIPGLLGWPRSRHGRGPRATRARGPRCGRVSRPVNDQLLCSHFTLKLVPLLSDDTETLARRLEFTVMILVGLGLPSFEPSTLELLK